MIRTSHVVLAVLLHVVVIGMLLIGFRCTKKVDPPPVIQATIIDSKPQGKPAPPKPEPPKPEPPKPEPPKPDPEVEKQKEREEQLKKEREEQRLEEQRRVEQQAQVRLQEEKKQEEKRKKEEAARKAREEQARKEKLKREQEQRALEDELRQQITSEETARQNQARASKQQLWISQISQKVKQNWLRPPGMADNFQCQLRVQLLPGGQVIGVQITKSCGNPILDDSVERAVRRSDPLPAPDDPAIFDRELNFTFIP